MRVAFIVVSFGFARGVRADALKVPGTAEEALKPPLKRHVADGTPAREA
jgi:hypothetical protein